MSTEAQTRATNENHRDSEVCSICGDREPFHVHDGDRRIEDYFTVGRGMSEMDAARAWQGRALAAERALDKAALSAGDREVLGHLVFYKGMARAAAEIGEAERMGMSEVTARLRRLQRLGLVRHFPRERKQAGLWQATPAGLEMAR